MRTGYFDSGNDSSLLLSDFYLRNPDSFGEGKQTNRESPLNRFSFLLCCRSLLWSELIFKICELCTFFEVYFNDRVESPSSPFHGNQFLFFSCSQIFLLKNCPTKSPSALKHLFLYDGNRRKQKKKHTAPQNKKTIHRATQKTDERTLLCDLAIDTRWPRLQWTIDAKKLFLRILF